MIYTHATIIVTSSVATALRNVAQKLDRAQTDGMFTTGLSATGSAPASHFVSSGQVPETFAAAMRSPSLLNTTAQAAFIKEGLTYPFTLTQITSALAGCSISDGTFNSLPESPHQFMARRQGSSRAICTRKFIVRRRLTRLNVRKYKPTFDKRRAYERQN